MSAETESTSPPPPLPGRLSDLADHDEVGNEASRARREIRLRRRAARSRHRGRRKRPDYPDMSPLVPPPPPSYRYQSAYPPPPPPPYYPPDSSFVPYSPYVAAPYQPLYPRSYKSASSYQTPPAAYQPPPIPNPPPASYQAPPAPYDPPPPLPPDPTESFRTVEHRFAGWLFRIHTDAAPFSKKLKVKRVGDFVEYYSSGVLLTKIKYKLDRDIFSLYADRHASPLEDKELISKIEILMAGVVAEVFEYPWDMRDLKIAWGVSECPDVGHGDSLLVNVSRDTYGGEAFDSLSTRSSMRDVTASPSHRSDPGSSYPFVSEMNALQRLSSYEKSVDGTSRSTTAQHSFERSQIVAVLRRVELVTAMELGRRSYLMNSEVASVIGSKEAVFRFDGYCGRFQAQVPTLFGLFVSKLRNRAKASAWFHELGSDYPGHFKSNYGSAGQYDLEDKPFENPVTGAPPPVTDGGPISAPAPALNFTSSSGYDAPGYDVSGYGVSAYGASGYSASGYTAPDYFANVGGSQSQSEAEDGGADNESQASGDDPFAQSDSEDDTEKDPMYGEIVPNSSPPSVPPIQHYPLEDSPEPAQQTLAASIVQSGSRGDTEKDPTYGETVATSPAPLLPPIDHQNPFGASPEPAEKTLLVSEPLPPPRVNEVHSDDGSVKDSKGTVGMGFPGTTESDSPSDQQQFTPPRVVICLPPPSAHAHGSSISSSPGDDFQLTAPEKRAGGPSTSLGVPPLPRDVRTPSMKNVPEGHVMPPAGHEYSVESRASGGDEQELGGHDELGKPEEVKRNEPDDSEDVSRNEGQTQVLHIGTRSDVPTPPRERESSVEAVVSVDEHQDVDGSNALIGPGRGHPWWEGDSDGTSSEEGQTQAQDSGNDSRKLKSILRDNTSRRTGKSQNQVQFSLPAPAYPSAEDPERKKLLEEERHKQERKEAIRIREMKTYRTPQYAAGYANPYAAPYSAPQIAPHTAAYPNRYPTPPELSGGYYGAGSTNGSYPSEDPEYREAVNSGEVYYSPVPGLHAPKAPQISIQSDAGNWYGTNVGSGYDAFQTPLRKSDVSNGDLSLPAPATSGKHSQSHSRLNRRFSGLTRKSSYQSRRSEETSPSSLDYSNGYVTGKNRASLLVAKDLFTVILGVVIVALSMLAIGLDPAGEENWFKRLEQGVFVMFSLGLPALFAMRSRLSDNLDVLLPKPSREVRSVKDLQNMNKGMPYEDFVKQLQKAILVDEELSDLFSFKNAGYKLSRKSGKLVVPEAARYSKTFKRVWFFGEYLAYNKHLGKAFRYRHENNVLYIDKACVDVEGVIVHVRRRVGKYILGSAMET